MKKNVLLLFLTLCIIPVKVFAAGGFGVATGSVSMYPGESRVVAITSSNAVGRLDISSSNGGVAGVGPGSVFIQTPGASSSITITGNAVGTAVVTVTASENFATFDEEILAGQTRTITVNVVPVPAPTPSDNTNNYVPNSGSNNNYNNVNPITDGDNKSANNNIKELKIEGFELVKIDNNNYTLVVPKNIDSINISAMAEDNKATITGSGKHDLIIGDNTIGVIVTAENGVQNVINIKVTRKENYYLEDLDVVLKDNKINNPEIVIKEDTKISAKDFEKIKSSKKTVNFNYYNNDKKLIYSFIIDGSKLKNTSDFITTISNNSDNKNEILKLSNYADGLFRVLKQANNLPNGMTIKLFVGDKYQDNDLVNIYVYNKDKKKLEVLKNKVKVEKGYIEFSAINMSDYFITMSNIGNLEEVVVPKDNSIFPLIIVLIIIGIIGVGGLVYFFLVKNKGKKDDNNTSAVIVNSRDISSENIAIESSKETNDVNS